jgi:O-antigen ligase
MLNDTSEKHLFKNAVSRLLLVFIVALPLLYWRAAVDPSLLIRQIALMCFVFAASVLLVVKSTKQETYAGSLLIWLFVGLVLSYIASVFSALNKPEAIYITSKITGFAMYFFILYFAFQKKFLSKEEVNIAVALSGVMASILGFTEICKWLLDDVDITKAENIYRVTATFGHKNLLSGYVFVCLSALVSWALFTENKRTKWILIVLVIAQTILLIVLQTRAVLLAMGVSVMAFMILQMQNKFIAIGKKRIIGILSLALLLSFIGTVFLFKHKLTNLTRTESFIERKNVWYNTVQMISEHTWAGVGAGNWQIFFPKYGMEKFYEVNYTISEGFTTFQRPHNDFLWVISETGVFGGLLFVSLFMLAGYNFLQMFKCAKSLDDQNAWLLMFLQFVSFVCISLVDFPLERIEQYAVVLPYMALAATRATSAKRVFISMKIFWIISLLALIAAYISIKRLGEEYKLQQVYKSHSLAKWQNLISHHKKLNPQWISLDYFSVPVSWYAGVGYFMQNNIGEAKRFFEEAYRIHPYQVHVLNNLAACYEAESNHQQAIFLLEEAHRISPTFSDGIINLSGAYFNAQRYDDAYSTISKFKYDEQNERFKTFALAIVRKKLELSKSQLKLNQVAVLQINDSLLLGYIKSANSKGFDILTMIKSGR